VAAIFFSGFYYGVRYRPHWKDTTACVDALGLKERVTTMFALGDDDSVISKLQREDALAKLREVKPRQLKIRLLSWRLLAVAVSLVFFGAAMALPLNSVTSGSAATQGQPPAQSEPPEGETGATPPGISSEPPSGGMPGGGQPSGAAIGVNEEEPEKIYDPGSGAVPYEEVYDEYYANALAGMNESETGNEQKDVVDNYFDSLK
jgi:hypothetical protein